MTQQKYNKNLSTVQKNEYLKFSKNLMILWITILVFVIILTFFSIMMLIFDISYNQMQAIYTQNGGEYDGYSIQELITPVAYNFRHSYAFYGSNNHIAYGFHYNDSRVFDDGSSLDTTVSLNQYLATQILMIYPDLYLTALGYPVSNGPGTYGYEFANLFYNWLEYATNTDNNIYHSAGSWGSAPEPGTVFYTQDTWADEDKIVWQGDSIYSIFAINSWNYSGSNSEHFAMTVFYVWSTPSIFDFWYQDWWNSDYFNYNTSVPTVYYDYDSYTYGEMDKQIIDSLRILMPATTGYTTSSLFPSGFVSGDQITNLVDNSLSNHVYIVFQTGSNLNPANAANLDSIWGATTHDPKIYFTKEVDSKSLALSITQTILILISLILLIFIFTPMYRKNIKTFKLLNVIIPIILIIAMIIMIINYSYWVSFNNSFEGINDLQTYDSFISEGPLNLNYVNDAWNTMFHYNEGPPIEVSLTIDQFTNDGYYATWLGDNSYTFRTARLYLDSSSSSVVFDQLGFVVVGSFQFTLNYRFLFFLNILTFASFLNHLFGSIFTYLSFIAIIVISIIIFIYTFFMADTQITLYYNNMKSIVDKKVDQMNETKDKVNQTKNTYNKK